MRAFRLLLFAALIVGLTRAWLFGSSAAADGSPVEAQLNAMAVVVPQVEDIETKESNVRGVPSYKEHLYTASSFECGDTVVEMSMVNDDYCDCMDGSDEPGTSACAGRAKSSFFCRNELSQSIYLQTSKVDDGICDCCDGSDEMTITCVNTCEEEGREYRERLERLAIVRKEGLERKSDYVRRAETALATAGDRKASTLLEIEKLQSQFDSIERDRAELESIVNAKKLELEKQLTERRIEALGLHRFSEKELQIMLVNLAAKTKEGAVLKSLVEKSAPEGSSEIKWIEEGGKSTVTSDADYDPEDDMDHDGDHYHHHSHDDEYHDGVEEVTLKEEQDRPAKGEDEEKLASLTDDSDTIKRELAAVKTKLEDIEKEDEMDFGELKEFWVLKNECFSTKAQEYTYEICFYGKAKQDSVLLGEWKGFSDDYSQIEFAGGSKCWNGPARKLTVTLECGAEEALHTIEEPSMCEYQAQFATPAAC